MKRTKSVGWGGGGGGESTDCRPSKACRQIHPLVEEDNVHTGQNVDILTNG
jgi:hypothetical protein